MRFDRFEALTFDCYGTLIDWESGLLGALAPVLEAHGVEGVDAEAILELFARLEAEAEAGRYRTYREVLSRVMAGMGDALGFEPGPPEVDRFASSVGAWPAFPDTVDALHALAERYRLAIVSNVDDDLFSETATRLGVAFDVVVTAEQVRSYKPATEHFEEALSRLALPADRVLHVAQSLFHDVAPAKAMGLTCVWVNRRSGKEGGGATPQARATPDLEVPDLRTLAELALPRP